MKVMDEIPLSSFEAWSGAVETLDRILEENKGDILEDYIEDAYPDGITATQLNDILWFDQEFVYRLCGIDQDDEEDECAMNEIEALRRFAADNSSVSGIEIVESVARSIEENYVRLPTFDDGSTVRIGDMVDDMQGDGIIALIEVSQDGDWTLYDDISDLQGCAHEHPKRGRS